MTREDLFIALGEVEESKLLHSELALEARPGSRYLRNLLIAAIVIGALTLTAFGAGYLLFDSPQAMLIAIFGDNTGFDHGAYVEVPDPERPGGILAAQPAFDRTEPDPTVVEDIAPYVSPVGRSLSYHGITLTVDSFFYDSATRCGVVTYTLENGPEYYLQFDGQISYYGPSPVDLSHFGNSYIIQEKTTPTCLAAVCYFHLWNQTDEFYVTLKDSMTYEERMDMYEQASEQICASYTPEEMVTAVQAQIGEAEFAAWLEESGRSAREIAFEYLRDKLVMEWMEGYEDTCQEKILFDCSRSREMRHLSVEDGGVVISPISLVVDIEKLPFLQEEDRLENINWIQSIVLRFSDGSEYTVVADQVSNVLYNLYSTADGTGQTEYTVFTLIFNRIVDLDMLTVVVINDQIIPIS